MMWTPCRIKKKTCQRAGELNVSQHSSISHAQLCLRISSAVVLRFFEEIGGSFFHSSQSKTLHSTKHKNTNKTKNPLRGSTYRAAAKRRVVLRMTGLGQSLWDPHSLMTGGKLQGKLPG